MAAIELREVSWLERLMESVATSALGVVLVGGSVALLWWNENRTVRRVVAIRDVRRTLQNVDNPATAPNGTVVHVSGRPSSNNDILARDPVLSILTYVQFKLRFAVVVVALL
jgi:hypothetical protein